MILYSPFDLLLHISQMITCGKHFACDFHCIINLALFCSFVDRDFVDVSSSYAYSPSACHSVSGTFLFFFLTLQVL